MATVWHSGVILFPFQLLPCFNTVAEPIKLLRFSNWILQSHVSLSSHELAKTLKVVVNAVETVLQTDANVFIYLRTDWPCSDITVQNIYLNIW